MLKALIQKGSSCKVKIAGKDVRLHFRPFTMRDMAWVDELLNTDEARAEFAAMRSDLIARAIWHLFTPESKQFFSGVRFTDVNDDGDIIDVDVLGHEKLMESITNPADIFDMFEAMTETQNISAFIPSLIKKKIKTKAKKQIGWIATTLSRLNIATQSTNSLTYRHA